MMDSARMKANLKQMLILIAEVLQVLPTLMAVPTVDI